MEKPNCYECKYRGNIPGDCHSCCTNLSSNVKFSDHGTRMGWAFWPFNFDPVWLISCDGFGKENYGKSIISKVLPDCKRLSKLEGLNNDK